MFGRIAEFDPVPCPALGALEAELAPGDDGFVEYGTPVQRYAWCRALTHMRDLLTAKAHARLVVGGKIEGYHGRMPGLLEESLLSLRARKPLFLAGALGGCTELVGAHGFGAPPHLTLDGRQVARLVDVLQAGVNHVHNIQFRTTQLRKHRDGARIMAIQAAHDKAVALAKTQNQMVQSAGDGDSQ